MHVAYWLLGSVTTQNIANRALHAMSMPLSGPIAIPNERDSHALGMRACDKSCSDERRCSTGFTASQKAEMRQRRLVFLIVKCFCAYFTLISHSNKLLKL
jgi:hypothetical protein